LPGQEKILRRRIRSINSTKKITRAMELIAASRIVKAQARVIAAQPYAEGLTAVVANLAAGGAGLTHPLLQGREEVRRVAHVVLTADRGLCGAYNASVLRAAEGELRDHASRGREYSLILVGRKAESYFRFRNYRVDAAFTGFTENPTYEDARAVAAAVSQRFVDGELDFVQLIYTRFISSGRQEVVIRPLMPLEQEPLDVHPDEAPPSGGYEFEPAPDLILDRLLPRYVEARVYAALLNAAASEQAARQRAMKAATDNAEDLIVTLSRVMNRARQDAITTEIMEVVGGAEALRGSRGGADHHALVASDYLPD
jgi:F-type H+-transporting ATPase subunit gamma